MIMPTVIAIISPCPGSGKSTTANYLLNYYRNAKIVPLAQPLKKMLASLMDSFGIDQFEQMLYSTSWKEEPIEKIPGSPSYRRLAQTIGTEWGRNLIDNDLWVDAWKESISSFNGVVIVDDCRRLNEYKAIAAMPGSLILRIVNQKTLKNYRKSLPRNFWQKLLKITPRYGHASEGELKTIPVLSTIYNDGTLEELYAQIDAILNK
jgi:hypothetical protein